MEPFLRQPFLMTPARPELDRSPPVLLGDNVLSYLLMASWMVCAATKPCCIPVEKEWAGRDRHRG